MGVYHQGGVVPAQLAMPDIISTHTVEQGIKTHSESTVFWWKTYSPPRWLLGSEQDNHIHTADLMGIPGLKMIQHLDDAVPRCPRFSPVYLVAPTSATFLDEYSSLSSLADPHSPNLQIFRLWTYRQHLNLDDLDFGDDGVVDTLKRVVGRRGLSVWSVRRACK